MDCGESTVEDFDAFSQAVFSRNERSWKLLILGARDSKKGSVFLVKLAKQIVVRGRVQGVGFRWATKMIADNLNISGTIENRSDGSVFIQAAGEPLNLAKFVAQVKAGPNPYANVSTYEEKPLENIPDFHGFRVTG